MIDIEIIAEKLATPFKLADGGVVNLFAIAPDIASKVLADLTGRPSMHGPVALYSSAAQEETAWLLRCDIFGHEVCLAFVGLDVLQAAKVANRCAEIIQEGANPQKN